MITLNSVVELPIDLSTPESVEVELEISVYPLIDTIYSVFLPIDLIVPTPEILTLPSINA